MNNVLQRMGPQLELHGISYQDGDIDEQWNVTRYEVHVVDIAVKALREQRPDAWVSRDADKAAGRLSWRGLDVSSLVGPARKAARMGLRAAYALNLKEAHVKLYVGAKGRVIVTNVCDQYDRLPSSDRSGVRGEAAGGVRHMKANESTGDRKTDAVTEGLERPMIGMDPEFLLIDPKKRMVFAEQFLAPKGTVGCDAAVVNGAIRYPLAELRPAPHVEPKSLLLQLRATMRKAARAIPDTTLCWQAGGLPLGGLPLGGHIHFSGLPLNGELLRTLDNYLALPVLMLEDERSITRRPKFGYLGDFRLKPHGFEYRVLPSWLISPRIAAGVLSIARLIADHHAQLQRRPLSRVQLQQDFYKGDKIKLSAAVALIWSDLEETEGYAAYAEYLEPFKKLVLTRQTWNADADLRRTWKL